MTPYRLMGVFNGLACIFFDVVVVVVIIRGDTMLYKNAVGGMGMIQSDVFCRALCDVYYGKDAVSPSHKEDVIKGIKGL